VVGALSDEAWGRICAAAGRAPDAGTRERLSVILFEEYSAFTFDREREQAKLRLGKLMLERLGAFAEFYRRVWLCDVPEDEVEAIFAGLASAFLDDKSIERDCWSIARLRLRAEALFLGAERVLAAYRGKRNIERAWLYGQLCHVWIWNFHGTLTATTPPLGGPPGGALIKFLLAVLRLVIPEEKLPNAYGLKDVIVREDALREKARQLGLFLQERLPPLPPAPPG
jgi:hypothetical protein